MKGEGHAIGMRSASHARGACGHAPPENVYPQKSVFLQYEQQFTQLDYALNAFRSCTLKGGTDGGGGGKLPPSAPLKETLVT